MNGSNQSSLTRRTFLKTTALTAGAMAVAGAAGCSSISAESPIGQGQDVQEEVYTGTCRGNCGGYCIQDVKVREGKIVSTVPVASPQYEGTTAGCVRGPANIARVYNDARITHPLKRVGERGSGEWEQISWDEAIELIADRFQTAFDNYGAKSVGIWWGAGNAAGYLGSTAVDGGSFGLFAQKTGCTLLGYGSDWAGMYMRWSVLGVPQGSAEDFRNAKTIVLWGSNPAAASNNRTNWYWICKARENGAKLITIDPLYTETAAHSDKWLPVRVGTDGALMCAMIHHIVDNKLFDEDYLRNKSVAPLLVKEDGSYLRLSDLGKAAEESEENVPVVWDELSESFVSHLEATKPAYEGTYEANGISVRTAFDLSMESIASFDLDYAEKECGLPADDIIELAEACVNGMPTMMSIDWGLEHTYNCFHLYYNAALLASLIGCVGVPGAGYSTPSSYGTQIWKAPITTDKTATTLQNPKPNAAIMGNYMIDIMNTGKWNGEDMTLAAVYIQAHNPLDNACSPNELIKAWDKIGFVVTADPFMTTTAHYSDLVLPVTLPFESEDFFHIAPGSFFPLLQQKAVDPIGEAKTDFAIWRMICEKMGMGDLYTLETEQDYLRAYLNTPENIEAGLTYDDYVAAGGRIANEYTYTEYTAAEYNPLGRTQFYIEKFVPRIQHDYPLGDHDNLPYYEEAAEAYWGNPDREKYPLFGFSNHDVYHGQSLHAHNKWLDQFRTFDGTPFCRIHEKAAAERGIQTGDLVRCFNDHGYVVLTAVVTKGIREDSVWLPHGFFWDEFIDGFAQSLTGHYIDPQTSNANFNDMILQVEKYEGGMQE